jgi:hypothetical protein
MRRYQLGLLIALSLGMTGCQTSGSSSPSTWSWNPWASKDTAVAKSDSKNPPLPSETAKDPKSTSVASRSTPGATPSYPTTGAPPANYGTPQQGAYPPAGAYAAQPNGGYPTQPAGGYPTQQPANGYAAAQPAPAYGAQPAYGAAPAGGYPNNTTVAAGYTANGFGGYGQPTAATTPAAPTGYGASPTGYGATPPAYGSTPTNVTPSAYGQQPNPGPNPYAQPPAQPGATPGYGQGASYDSSNPGSAFASGNFAQAAAAAPARNTTPFMPGSIKPMTASTNGASSTVQQAGFDAKPGEAIATAAPAYGTTPAGMTCENGICYPNGSTTTAAPAGYTQPAAAPSGYGSPSAAPASAPAPTIYR